MSRGKTHPKLLTSREYAEGHLKKQIREGRIILIPANRFIPEKVAEEAAMNSYRKWLDYNSELLGRIFDDERYLKEYGSISTIRSASNFPKFYHGVTERINKLESILNIVESGLISVPSDASSVNNEDVKSVVLGSDVFIVHGRNEGVREHVARFIEKIGLNPVILREQPNSGRTIIEKFEYYSDVGFAVVLMTPDDVGEYRDKEDELRCRARQNVILELGFFLGKIGRDRVCVLYKEGVEIPSDYTGVGYVLLDEHDAWCLELAKEIKAAGIPVDMI